MKQVKVNDLVVLTAPDTDARMAAATIARQAALLTAAGWDRMVEHESDAADIERGFIETCTVGSIVISVVDADITHHVPDCGHELYAAGRCRSPRCANYYLKVNETRKDVAA